MIQNVSLTNKGVSFKQSKVDTKATSTNNSKFASYSDSFVKNSIESAPMLLGITGAWTAYDVFMQKIAPKKAITHNFLGFFIPVLAFSSAVLAIVENKKTSKSSN